MPTKIIVAIAALLSFNAHATLRVVTTTEDLGSITRSLGKDLVEVTSIARGTQDPHFIEAKPSYMVKLSRADLVLSIGLSLETGWLPLLLRGARQPKILPGQPGYLEVSEAITAIEIKPQADRSEGDVHPFGNPHFMADPERAIQVGKRITAKLAELDAAHSRQYQANFDAWENALKGRIANWKTRLAKARGLNVIGYHKTFNYFLQFFGVKAVGYLEPKPGIPPSAGHILSLIELAKKEKVHLVVIENYFDNKQSKGASDQMGAKLVILPAYTGGDDRSGTYEEWFEQLVSGLEKEVPH